MERSSLFSFPVCGVLILLCGTTVGPDDQYAVRSIAGADMHATSYVEYPSLHKSGGAWLETLTVQIGAPRDIADGIVSSIDWNEVSRALTR